MNVLLSLFPHALLTLICMNAIKTWIVVSSVKPIKLCLMETATSIGGSGFGNKIIRNLDCQFKKGLDLKSIEKKVVNFCIKTTSRHLFFQFFTILTSFSLQALFREEGWDFQKRGSFSLVVCSPQKLVVIKKRIKIRTEAEWCREGGKSVCERNICNLWQRAIVVLWIHT